MTTFVALLRAVNVGGTGRLPMADLVELCQAAGFVAPRTYIASGNVVFSSPRSEPQVQSLLAKHLAAYAGKPVGVLVRTGAEMQAVLAANPFRSVAANRTVAIFLDTAPPADALQHLTGLGDEQIRLGRREIYVHYGAAMAGSKLKIPAAKAGTARNMNTVARLAAMAAGQTAP